jgi:AcrR family transcriptional regulator
MVQLDELRLDTRRATDTRERLLDVAESAVLDKGFAATSIEELIAAVGITKSGFFYHFKNKNELARALLQRYLDREANLLDDIFERADQMHDDPLDGFLEGLRLLADVLSDLPGTHPGCMVAAICYQEQLFDREIRELNRRAMLGWRMRFRAHLETIAERHPPRIAVDFDSLADMVCGIVDGGIVLSRVHKNKDLLPQQVMLYHAFVRAVFVGT